MPVPAPIAGASSAARFATPVGRSSTRRESLRVELGFEYQEIADATGQPSANAVRMAIVRGLARLVENIDADAAP